MKQISLISEGEEQTRALGEKIGTLLNSSAVIGLIGDLGSGKTVLVRGLAAGLKVDPRYYITSPTFTLINEYPGRLPLFHVDLYRLESGVDFEDIGLLDILYDDRAVVAMEWAEKISEDFSDRLMIRFDYTGENQRRLEITAHGKKFLPLIKKLEM